MMSHQPLEPAFMQECGSSLLRSLQNESMVPLDLLVRESIQNSLDAGLGTGPVQVEFNIRPHSAAAIVDVLGERGGIARRLRDRYPGPQRLLEIRDSNTAGLTGPVRLKGLAPGQPHGNLLKLVYEIGRSQGDENKGGSWGLGKTVYFRMGAGLVFYYSRIREEAGKYAERLAACLVEDEGKVDRLQTDSVTGISWWGASEGPLETSEDIAKVLSVLGVRAYSGSETGTTIVLPFLRDDLRPIVASSSDEDGDDAASVSQPQTPWWHANDEDYLSVAAQRWYCLRLDNPSFVGGPPLNVTIGGKPLRRHEMLPVFRIAQGLYNRAAYNRAPAPDFLGHIAPTLNPVVEDVGPLNSTLSASTKVGRVAIAKLTAEHLGMMPPHNQPSPMQALYGRERAAPWRPAVGFLRSHGMIVRWDDRADAGGWSLGVPATEDGLLLAIFVPDGSQKLHPKLLDQIKRRHLTLESFLRGCELADHHQWTDPAGVTVVKRVRARVADRLKAHVIPQDRTPPGTVPLHAARALADRLLPTGFGRDGRTGLTSSGAGHEPTPPRSPAGKAPTLEVREVRHRPECVEVDWRVSWRGSPSPCVLRVAVASEARPFTLERWQRESAGPFPLAILAAALAGAAAAAGGEAALTITGQRDAVVLDPGRSTSKRPFIVEGSLSIRVTPPSGAAIQPVLSLASLEQNEEVGR